MTEPKAGYEVLTVDGYLHCIDKTKAGVELKTTKGTKFVRAKIGEIEAAAFKESEIELIMELDGNYCRMEYYTQGKYHNFVNAWIIEPSEEVKRPEPTETKSQEQMTMGDWREVNKERFLREAWIEFIRKPDSIAAFSPNMDIEELGQKIDYMLWHVYRDDETLKRLAGTAYKKATK